MRLLLALLFGVEQVQVTASFVERPIVWEKLAHLMSPLRLSVVQKIPGRNSLLRPWPCLAYPLPSPVQLVGHFLSLSKHACNLCPGV